MENENGKILLIAKYFPPNCNQNGWMIRIVEMANFLVRNGYSVTVVTVDRAKKYDVLLEIDSRIEVHYVKSRFTYYSNASSLPYLTKITDRLYKGLYRRYLKLKRWLRHDELLFNQEELNIYKKSKKLIEKENIRNVLITVPDYDIIKIGILLKREFGSLINAILDYRDIWTLDTRFRSRVGDKNKKLYKVACKIENWAINELDHFLFVTELSKKPYSKKYGNHKFHIVKNGFINRHETTIEKNFFSKTIKEYKDKNTLLIGHFGNAINKNIIHKFIELLENQKEKNEIVFVIQGKHDKNDFDKYGIKILLFDAVSNKEVIKNMRNIDVGIYLDKRVGSGIAMGGRIYDYIGSGIPIWIVGEKNNGELHKFAQKYNNIYFCDYDVDEIGKTVKRIMKDKKDEKLIKKGFEKEDAFQYSRDHENSKLIDFLK